MTWTQDRFTLRAVNRREFLARSSLFAAAGLLGRPRAWAGTGPAAAPSAPVASSGFHPLRRNVGVFIDRGGTIGWLVDPGALAVVDTQFPDTALACLDGLPGRANRPIDVVLNTHHHADHTGGNPSFKPECRTIVAQANVPNLQFEAARRAEASPRPQAWATVDKQVFADTTFTDVWRRELGGEIVTAQFHGAAHTGGDAIITFERANVVHMGDIVFNRMYPAIDRPGGATIRGWIRVLGAAIQTYPADAIYVYGHGNPRFGITGSRSDLQLQRDFLTALLERVQRDISAGKSKAEIVAVENFPGFPDLHTPLPNRLGLDLGAAYDELTS